MAAIASENNSYDTEKPEFDLNKMVFDPAPDARLVHYLGHFGNVKALRYFYEVAPNSLNLRLEDKHT